MSELEKEIFEISEKVVSSEQVEMINQLNKLKPIQTQQFDIATPNEIFQLGLKNYRNIFVQSQVR